MSDELHWNKIFGAGLATVLVILGAGQIAAHVYKSEPPKTPGYKVAVAETAADGGAEQPEMLPDWGAVLPTADAAAGQATFAKCQACHNNANGGPNQIGPNLFGVVGRPTASHPGFAYSDAMKAHAKDSANWTYDQLFQFLKGPQNWVPGTKMTFAGVKDPKDRINLIAYLRTQGSTGYAIPAPDPKREAKAAPVAPGAAKEGAAGGGPAGQAPTAGAAAAPTAQAAAPAGSVNGNASPAAGRK
jgi:cytochrome c